MSMLLHYILYIYIWYCTPPRSTFDIFKSEQLSDLGCKIAIPGLKIEDFWPRVFSHLQSSIHSLVKSGTGKSDVTQ